MASQVRPQVHHAWAEVLDDHVGGVEEGPEHLLPGIGREVERHQGLARIGAVVAGRPFPEVVPLVAGGPAHAVQADVRLDLDEVGAEDA